MKVETRLWRIARAIGLWGFGFCKLSFERVGATFALGGDGEVVVDAAHVGL